MCFLVEAKKRKIEANFFLLRSEEIRLIGLFSGLRCGGRRRNKEGNQTIGSEFKFTEGDFLKNRCLSADFNALLFTKKNTVHRVFKMRG